METTASSQGHDEDVQEQMRDEQGIAVAFEAAGYETVHGVAGRYVQGSEGNAETMLSRSSWDGCTCTLSSRIFLTRRSLAS